MPDDPSRTARFGASPSAGRRRRDWLFRLLLALVPLTGFIAFYVWSGAYSGKPSEAGYGQRQITDRESALFSRCIGPIRRNCVVDGDTFWYRGQKIRIADINTPETNEPKCREEAELGRRATRRLTALLNAGPFSLRLIERDRDRYGRMLRVVTRRGESLGAQLVAEGLAERWQGYRGDWCPL